MPEHMACSVLLHASQSREPKNGLASVVAGSPAEAALGERVTGGINLAGKTTLRQIVALLRGATLVIA